MIDRDSLLPIFFQSDKIDYDSIVKKILLPYFKLKSRVVKRNMEFRIGELTFKVTGAATASIGTVTSLTFIQCNQFFSMKTPIERALIFTTRKLENFSAEELRKDFFGNQDELVERDNHVENYRASTYPIVVNKSLTFKVGSNEFLIRNCQPESGILTTNSIITVENQDITYITRIKIAVLKVNGIFIVFRAM